MVIHFNTEYLSLYIKATSTISSGSNQGCFVSSTPSITSCREHLSDVTVELEFVGIYESTTTSLRHKTGFLFLPGIFLWLLDPRLSTTRATPKPHHESTNVEDSFRLLLSNLNTKNSHVSPDAKNEGTYPVVDGCPGL